jgi:hypothetical protein
MSLKKLNLKPLGVSWPFGQRTGIWLGRKHSDRSASPLGGSARPHAAGVVAGSVRLVTSCGAGTCCRVSDRLHADIDSIS